MKLGYDNLEDAKVKLVGTYCLYGGKAVTIKAVYPVDQLHDNGKYTVHGAYMMSGRAFECSLDDPLFNCTDYKIGYVNRFNSAGWYYRIPMKQYKQGLRYDQVSMRASRRGFYGVDFKASKPVAAMLEGNFPTFHQGVKMLRDGEAEIISFHRNFAMTLDVIHDDFILEYKGENIGFTRNLEDFKLMKEHEHLYEQLKEATA